jgi:ankyrin repeat protein
MKILNLAFLFLVNFNQTAFTAEAQTPYNEKANNDVLKALQASYAQEARCRRSRSKNMNRRETANEQHLFAALNTAIREGANPNLIVDGLGGNLFLFAIERGDGEMVKELIARGAKINFQAKWIDGTALMHACTHGRHEIVQILLLAGADKTIRDSDQKTARDAAKKRSPLATEEDQEKCLALLDTSN